MKKLSIFILFLLAFSNALFSQVGINTDGSNPDSSAILDVKSDNKGFLPPRMTKTERNAIVNPTDGLIVFCTDCGTGESGVVSVFASGIWNNYSPCLPPGKPVAGTHVPSKDSIVWKWNPVTGATGYKWNTSNDISTATDNMADTSRIEKGLICDSLYTRWVWAYNDCGTSGMAMLTDTTSACFTCGDSITDSRDGKKYSTILIDTQCWMKGNLNVGTQIDLPQYQTDNGIIEKYCYDNNETNCDVYGGLYQWNEMMEYVTTESFKGICPTGWHIPTDAEWTTLTDYLGGESVAGGKMKEIGTTHWASPNTGATDSFGFTALPGGKMDFSNTFANLFNNAYFWSSSEYNTGNAWRIALDYNQESMSSDMNGKMLGFSVRCIKD